MLSDSSIKHPSDIIKTNLLIYSVYIFNFNIQSPFLLIKSSYHTEPPVWIYFLEPFICVFIYVRTQSAAYNAELITKIAWNFNRSRGLVYFMSQQMLWWIHLHQRNWFRIVLYLSNLFLTLQSCCYIEHNNYWKIVRYANSLWHAEILLHD